MSVTDETLRRLAEKIRAEGCWCLRCMAENACVGDGTELIAALGYDAATIDCQGGNADAEEVLRRIDAKTPCFPE